MKFKTKYRLALWKSYVDRGRGLTSYFNELFLLFGFWQITQDKSAWLLTSTIILYGLVCFVTGWLYYRHGWQKAETEVQNQYNLFVRQMRKKFK